MSLADQVEQLSFGRSLPRIESCLGLFLAPEAMYLCEVRVDKGRPQVLHLLKLPMPGAQAGRQTKSAGTLSSDFLPEPDKAAAVLQKALSEGSWKSKHIMVSLSAEFGILRYFTMPAIDRRFWKTAVPVEAKKFIPIPFQTLASDYQCFSVPPGPDRRPRIGALFGVTQRKSLDGLRRLVEKLGLALVGTELAPVSVERLWDVLSPESAAASYAQVHFDGGSTRILVSEKGVPVFYREVMLADDATVMDRRKVDLVGCVDFARKQLGLPGLRQVRVSGQIGDIKAWQDAFAQDLGQPVSYQDTDKLLGLRGGQWGGYASIGAGLRHLTPGPLTLDLSAVGKISDEDRRTATAILAAGALLAGALAVIGLARGMKVGAQERELRGLTDSGGVFSDFQGKTPEEIALSIQQMREKVNSFGALTARQTPLTRILEVVAERIPESAWISDLKYDNPLAIEGKPQPRNLTLTGSASDKSRALEQEVAYRFGDTLRGDARFVEAFPAIESSVEAPRAAEGGGEAEARKPTSFVIKCASSREQSGA